NAGLASLGLAKHPDKTANGFDFLGYHFDPTSPAGGFRHEAPGPQGYSEIGAVRLPSARRR
ncbi:MAG: hypothetical protein O3C21_21010, partial [Verrucomicrobia bacterium]|nr:hypothetical protein [Verrucomicrobiota bacterium]